MGGVTVIQGDCREVLAGWAGPLFDVAACDPPYHLVSIKERFGRAGAAPAKVGATGAFARASAGFMGEEWDGGEVAFLPETWRAVWDVLKPGGYLIAFSHSTTYDQLAGAIRAAGFEVRDTILDAVASDAAALQFMASLSIDQLEAFAKCIEQSAFGGLLAWIYGSGMPKSKPLPKGIARALGAAAPEVRQWAGWGTAMKPALEPICLARKPLEGGVYRNVLKHGVGALNIDACRIPVDDETYAARNCSGDRGHHDNRGRRMSAFKQTGGSASELGRWPANFVHDGSEEVLAAFPDSKGQQSDVTGEEPSAKTQQIFGKMPHRTATLPRGDDGSAARFFYSAKAGPLDRLGTGHATVKRVDLMQWLLRLVTPPGGRVLDPFAGSGTTGIAAIAEGFDCTLIELLAKHVVDINRKLAIVNGEGRHKLVELNERRVQAGGVRKRPAPLLDEADDAA